MPNGVQGPLGGVWKRPTRPITLRGSTWIRSASRKTRCGVIDVGAPSWANPVFLRLIPRSRSVPHAMKPTPRMRDRRTAPEPKWAQIPDVDEFACASTPGGFLLPVGNGNLTTR